MTLVAALLREREREITDTLVDLLISTVHRVGARAEKKVTNELVNAFKRVSGRPVSTSGMRAVKWGVGQSPDVDPGHIPRDPPWRPPHADGALRKLQE